jgi:hypothetical protein
MLDKLEAIQKLSVTFAILALSGIAVSLFFLIAALSAFEIAVRIHNG